MPRTALAGTRIRERRLLLALRQADLARAAGISASYLNLIEHNRRRVGDDLLARLADALRTDPATLQEGAEAALIDTLRAAAGPQDGGPADPGVQRPEIDRVEELVGRFPGWAARIVDLARRQRDLEETVGRLSDRMAHDPYLSDALHEVLSAVTAVRSTAAILAETEDIDPGWRARFHANLHQDAVRVSEGAEALVAYLDGSQAGDAAVTAPLEELEQWRAAHGYHFPMLEGEDATAAPVDGAAELASTAARRLARGWAQVYAADARALPLDAFRAALDETGGDPGALAARFGADLARVMRRMAAMPGAEDVGLVICDGSGALVFRKPVRGFVPPRFGAACPLWPLFLALARPLQPVARLVRMAGRAGQTYRTLAISQPRQMPAPGAPALWEATMLVRPAPDADAGSAAAAPASPIGPGCRICPRADCPARREPSILSEAF